MEAIIDSVIGQLDKTITTVETSLPKDFPDHIATMIFRGMRDAAKKRFNKIYSLARK